MVSIEEFVSNNNASTFNFGSDVQFDWKESFAGTIWIVKTLTNRRTHKRDGVQSMRLYDVLRHWYGLSSGCASFVCEWLPEYAGLICKDLEYRPYSWIDIHQMSEQQLFDLMGDEGIAPDSDNFSGCLDALQEKGYDVYWDASFDGYLVISEG